MIYLVILLVLCQVIHFIYYQKIMLSAKRRHKVIDTQLRSLSQWVISNHQSLAKDLESIHALINQKTEVTEQIPLSVLIQAAHKEALEKVKLEHLQQYYSFLLQELQQAGSPPYKMPEPTDKEALLKNPLTQQLIKKEITGWLNGHSRFE